MLYDIDNKLIIRKPHLSENALFAPIHDCMEE